MKKVGELRTLSFLAFTMVFPICPGIFFPGSTRAGVADIPIDPGCLWLLEPWVMGPLANPWRLVPPWNPLPLLFPRMSTTDPTGHTSVTWPRGDQHARTEAAVSVKKPERCGLCYNNTGGKSRGRYLKLLPDFVAICRLDSEFAQSTQGWQVVLPEVAQLRLCKVLFFGYLIANLEDSQ